MSQSPLDVPSSLRRLRSRASASVVERVAAAVAPTADRVVFGLLVVVVLVVGYFQGTLSMVVTLPAVFGGHRIVVVQAVGGCLSLAGLFGCSGVVLGGKLAGTDDTSPPTTGPTVTAIVPVHRDAAALHRSVESLLESDYRNVEVVVVTEPGDEASRRRASRYDAVEVLVNTRYPGSKAGAINYAAEVTESEYLAVFDADERVDSGFVGTAVGKLADCDVVQGRTIPEPDGLVETVAYYESVVLGDLSQRLLSVVTDFTMAASRTVVMRRTAFETVGGYDPAMLTEDYAFAFDCYEADLDVVEQFSGASLIEAAHTPTDWWGQRKRWMTGYAQVLHSLVADCRPRENYRTVLSPLICAGSVLGNLFMLQLVSKAAVLVASGATGWLVVPLVVLVGSALALRAYDSRADRLDELGVGYLLVPAVLPLYSLAGIKALVEYCLTWQGEWYSVAKG